MKTEQINNLIKRLETEITVSKAGLEKDESLDRLKWIAKQYQGEDMVVSFDEIVERIKNEKDELKIMSGWKGLDDLLKGFRLQQLIVVSALTKSGKTSFLMDLTCNIELYAPLWLSYEESTDELIRKYLERNLKPPRGYSPLSLKGGHIEWIESKIIESIAKNNTKVVFIDQLDFIVPMNGDNHSLRVGQVMRDLKGLAKKWNIVIFLICHLVKTKMDTQPTLEDLKGSSSIGQEADTVILLWREMKRTKGEVVITNNVNVSVQANRRTGKTGNVKMIYEDGKFVEFDWSQDEEGRKAQDSFDNF